MFRTHLRPAPVIAFLVAATAFSSNVALADWHALAALEQTGARVSASAVDLSDNGTIQQLNSDVRLTPASLTKLVVAAAALSVWPADKMFKTQLYPAGSIDNGKLSGDIYLVGAGDPSLTGDNLLALAAQLKGAGVTSVSGRLIVVPAPFDSVLCETKDRCDASVRSATAYDAPLASIGTDFGNWCVDVRPTTRRHAGSHHRLHDADYRSRFKGSCRPRVDSKGTALRVERADGRRRRRFAGRRHDRGRARRSVSIGRCRIRRSAQGCC